MPVDLIQCDRLFVEGLVHSKYPFNKGIHKSGSPGVQGQASSKVPD